MICGACSEVATKRGLCGSHYNKEYYVANRTKVNSRNTENYRKGREALNANKADYRKLLKLVKTVGIADALMAVEHLQRSKNEEV